MTVEYRQAQGAMVPLRVHTVVISVQHDESISLDEMRRSLKEKVVEVVVPRFYLDEETVYHLQPSGRFVIGGPQVSNAAVLSFIKLLLCTNATLLYSLCIILILTHLVLYIFL